jgi:hypothetical protein
MTSTEIRYEDFQKSTFSPPQESCFACTRADGIVFIRDTKNPEDVQSDVILQVEEDLFDDFLARVRASNTFDDFLAGFASGTLTWSGATMAVDQADPKYPYVLGGQQGVLRYSRDEMEAFYQGAQAGEFRGDAVSTDGGLHVSA